MNKRTVKLLREAKALISDPAHWTHGEYARDANSRFVAIDSPSACRFCAVGALARAAKAATIREVEDEDFPAMDLLTKACAEIYQRNAIHQINDGKGHTAVIAIYDRAIELAESAP